MSDYRPSVSICLPVYNGEKYVREALTSILEQTFEDFELIISDNASTDRTQEICRDASRRDRRVRYFRADVNRGLVWNFNRLFELAEGPYLVWLAHDDVMGKEYISRCVEALKQDPGAVLAYTNANYIDDKGSVIKRLDFENLNSSEKPSWRFRNMILDERLAMCDPICGLMRTEVLKQTRLHQGFADSDRVLLAEIGLRGRFTLVPECLFSRRQHAEQSHRKYKDLRERTVSMDPTKSGKVFCPVLLEDMAFFSAIRRAKLPLGERLRCYEANLRRIWWGRERRREDLREGALSAIKRYVSEDQVRRLTAVKRRFSKPWFS
jgi:glycosyltransferase involved in cell wall biosynthesis